MSRRTEGFDLAELLAALPEIVPQVMAQVLPERYTPELAAQMVQDIAGQLRAGWLLRWNCFPDCTADHGSPAAPDWHTSHRVETALRDIDASCSPEENAALPWLAAQVVVINDKPQAYGRETRVWIDYGQATGELSPAAARQALTELRAFADRFEAVVEAAERSAAADFEGDPEIARLDTEATDRRSRAITAAAGLTR